MRYRKDFDLTAECGIYVCTNCREPFYPMELDGIGHCPDCDMACERATPEEIARAQAFAATFVTSTDSVLANWQYEVVHDLTLLGFAAWCIDRGYAQNNVDPPLRDLELP